MIPEGELREAEEAARRLLGAFSGTSRNEISINAGGAGVWIATWCCCVMLCCGLLAALWVSREFERYDAQLMELRSRVNAQQAYINAAYRQNSNLKPPEK